MIIEAIKPFVTTDKLEIRHFFADLFRYMSKMPIELVHLHAVVHNEAKDESWCNYLYDTRAVVQYQARRETYELGLCGSRYTIIPFVDITEVRVTANGHILMRANKKSTLRNADTENWFFILYFVKLDTTFLESLA